MDIKLLVLDIDGTLVPDGAQYVPPENVIAVAAARQAGVHVALATARSYRMARLIADQLDLDMPLICHGGAYIVDIDESLIYHQPLEMDIAREMATFADAEGHRLVITVNERNYLAGEYCPERDAPFEDIIFTAKNIDGLRHVPTRIATLDEHGSTALYTRFHDDCRAVFSRFYRQQTLYCVAAFHPHASKGNAVGILCRHLNIDPDSVLTMGDMETDISMFRTAGHSIAMPHSPTAVKAAASLIAPADQPAVAWAINRLLHENLITV